MHSSLEFLTTIIGTSQLSFGEFKAQGLAALFLAAGLLALLFYRE